MRVSRRCRLACWPDGARARRDRRARAPRGRRRRRRGRDGCAAATARDDAPAVRPPRVLGRPGDRRRVLRLRVHATRPQAGAAQHDGDGRRHRRSRVVPRLPDRPLPALAGRGVVERLLRGLPGGAVLLPVPRGPDRAPRRLPPVQHRVQARHRARPDRLPGRRLRVRAGHPGAPARGADVRGRRHRLHVLQGRRRRDHDVRPAHHGWHPRRARSRASTRS